MDGEPPDQMLEAEEDETAEAMREHTFEGPFESGSAGAEGGTGGGGGGGVSGVVVDGTGAVLGTGHFNPQTGMVDTDIVETTVVEESSGSGASVGGGGSIGGEAFTESSVGGGAGGGGAGAPSPASGFVPHGVIPPHAFKFTKTGMNEQRSHCVPIIFQVNTPIGPVQIKVGVFVTAPIKLRDGKILSEREAQLDSASAATAVAENMAQAMTLGAMNATEVMARYAGAMDSIMRSSGIGYRVQRCNASID